MYYQKFKGLWEECDALEAPYLCLFVCSSADGRINGKIYQRKRLIQLLIGLDECYSNIRGKILLLQPLPTITQAYTTVRQEEKQREGIAAKSATSIILNNYLNNTRYNSSNGQNYPEHTIQRSTQTSFKRKNSFRKGIYCGNCRKEGHLQEEYKIIGYPIGHPLYGKVQSAKQFKSIKVVNTVMSRDEANKPSTFGQAATPSEDHVSARMDQLQDQLNQVLLMIQQKGSHGIF
ncbi:hypothetical protein Tco_1090192 [Tanacetum coccineum]|uniref:Gag-pol polyprotein n=1 Tax=Tanacetum coccineum TaxID=301880 RepID=A0ABQ5I3H7_9ASTR